MKICSSAFGFKDISFGDMAEICGTSMYKDEVDSVPLLYGLRIYTKNSELPIPALGKKFPPGPVSF